MGVDETRCEHAPGSVDELRVVVADGFARSHRDDAVAVDDDVSGPVFARAEFIVTMCAPRITRCVSVRCGCIGDSSKLVGAFSQRRRRSKPLRQHTRNAPEILRSYCSIIQDDHK